jgi:hypothetical protein
VSEKNDYGQANVTMYAYRLLPDGTLYYQDDISFGIDPNGHGVGNCPPLLATASVNFGVGGEISITVAT